MIVLDTNVLSELTRQYPDQGVLGWLDSVPVTEVVTTAVTAAELLYGVARLPAGHRRTALTAAVYGLLDEDFRGRVEPFDKIAATHYAIVVADRDRGVRWTGSTYCRSFACTGARCLAHRGAIG